MASSSSRKKSRKEEGENLHIVSSRWNHKKRKNFFSRISLLHDDEEKEYWSRPRNNLRSPYPTKEKRQRRPRLVGSCNGLLCLQYYKLQRIRYERDDGVCVVWEPSTDKVQVIPNPVSMELTCDCGQERCSAVLTHVMNRSYGLFFDAQSQDYKFVSFTTNCYDERYSDGDSWSHKLSHHVQVYSVKNNSWKELSYPLLSKDEGHSSPSGGMGACVNGVCYWVAHCFNDDGDYPLILSFELATDKFSYFPYPLVHELDYYNDIMVELDGSLCLVFYPREKDESEEGGGGIEGEGIISFWVYSSSSSLLSWTRRMEYDVRVNGYHEPLWFGKKNNRIINGYSLLLLQGLSSHDDEGTGALVEYDYATRQFNTIIHQIQPHTDIFPYVETKNKNKNNIWHVSSSST